MTKNGIILTDSVICPRERKKPWRREMAADRQALPEKAVWPRLRRQQREEPVQHAGTVCRIPYRQNIHAGENDIQFTDR